MDKVVFYSRYIFTQLDSRQKAAGGKGGGLESSQKASKESKAIPPSDPNAETQASIQVLLF